MKRITKINLIILLSTIFLSAFLNVDNKEALTIDEYILSEEMKEYKIGVEPGSENTPMEWLEIASDKKNPNIKLLLSKKVVNLKEFNNDDVIKYENSSLRYYLNSDFYNTSFKKEEKKRIKLISNTTIYNEYDFSWRKMEKKEILTNEKIFILSHDEISKKYKIESKINTGKRWEKTKYVEDITKGSINIGDFWTRDIYKEYKYTCGAYFWGGGFGSSYNTEIWKPTDLLFVRPAMWYDFSEDLNIDDKMFEKEEKEFLKRIEDSRKKYIGISLNDSIRGIDYYSDNIVNPGYREINFGKYKDGEEKIDIRWKIVDEDEKTFTLISNSIIDYIELEPYKKDGDKNYYLQSNIRVYLNNNFYNDTFDSEEKEIIVKNKDKDFVTIPSYNDIFKYNLNMYLFGVTKRANDKLKSNENDKTFRHLGDMHPYYKFFIKDQIEKDNNIYLLSIITNEYHEVRQKQLGNYVRTTVRYNQTGGSDKDNINTFSGILPVIKIDKKIYNDKYGEIKVNNNYNQINFNEKLIFGKYEQDGILENGKEDIVWRVIGRNNKYYTLESEKALLVFQCKGKDYYPINKSELRELLNYEFTSEAFSYDEKNKLTVLKIDPNNGTGGEGLVYNDKVIIYGEGDDLYNKQNVNPEIGKLNKSKYIESKNIKIDKRANRDIFIIDSEDMDKILTYAVKPIICLGYDELLEILKKNN